MQGVYTRQAPLPRGVREFSLTDQYFRLRAASAFFLRFTLGFS